MAKNRQIYIDRWDGGLTEDIRSGNVRQFARFDHFDPFQSPYRAVPMGSFESVEGFNGNPNGVRSLNFQNLYWDGNKLGGLSRRSDGRGQVYWKENPSDASVEWESRYDPSSDIMRTRYALTNFPLLYADNADAYVSTQEGFASGYIEYLSPLSSQSNSEYGEFAAGTLVGRSRYPLPISVPNGVYITSGSDDIYQIEPAFAQALNTFSTVDFESADDRLAYIGFRGRNERGYFFLWDLVNADPSIRVDVGLMQPIVLGNVQGTYVLICDDRLPKSSASDTSNGFGFMNVKVISGQETDSYYRLRASSGGSSVIKTFRATQSDQVLWYARVYQEDGTYEEGIYSAGRKDSNSPLAVVKLIDTTSIGEIKWYHVFGNEHYFITTQNRVYRITPEENTIPSVIETVKLDGETLKKKKLSGISLGTEALPQDGKVILKARKDDQSEWKTLTEHTKAGSMRKNYTAQGFGEFHDMQVRLESTGGAVIKDLNIQYEELDDKGY